MFGRVTEVFWILALALVLAFGFFVMVGAFSPDEVVPMTVGVLVLIGMLTVRIAIELRRGTSVRDLASIRARERRGF
jgi:hypothetical protein